MRDHGRDVDRPHAAVERIEVFGKRLPIPGESFGERGTWNVFDCFHEFNQLLAFRRTCGRKTDPTVAGNDCGDAMHRRRLEQLIPGCLAVVMRMVVDEPGCDDESTRIDYLRAVTVNCAPDLYETAIRDGDITDETRCAGAVDDGSVSDHEVIHSALLS